MQEPIRRVWLNVAKPSGWLPDAPLVECHVLRLRKAPDPYTHAIMSRISNPVLDAYRHPMLSACQRTRAGDRPASTREGTRPTRQRWHVVVPLLPMKDRPYGGSVTTASTLASKQCRTSRQSPGSLATSSLGALQSMRGTARPSSMLSQYAFSGLGGFPVSTCQPPSPTPYSSCTLAPEQIQRSLFDLPESTSTAASCPSTMNRAWPETMMSAPNARRTGGIAGNGGRRRALFGPTYRLFAASEDAAAGVVGPRFVLSMPMNDRSLRAHATPVDPDPAAIEHNPPGLVLVRMMLHHVHGLSRMGACPCTPARS